MEENGEPIESDDIVIIVENEAESKPIQEAKPKEESSLGLLDICPLCKLSFHSREPKLLPCLHSFCKRCLPSPSRNLAYTEQSTNHQMPSEGQGKPCMITFTSSALFSTPTQVQGFIGFIYSSAGMSICGPVCTEPLFTLYEFWRKKMLLYHPEQKTVSCGLSPGLLYTALSYDLCSQTKKNLL